MRTSATQGTGVFSGSSQTPTGTPAAAVRRRRRPRRRPQARSPRAGRPAAPGRPGTGRPWCRSSGGPGRRRPRRPRRSPRIVVPPKPLSANDERAAARIAARVSGAPGRRPRGAALVLMSGARTKCSRANSSDSRRSASRSSRVDALRVLISSTMWPSKPVPARWLEEAGRVHGAPARHEVLVLGRAGAVGQVHVAQPVAEPLGHLDRRRTGRSRRARGRWWRCA